ncbi:hypothetical protein Dimus_017332 [Dionaea muscipula]
MASGKTRTSKRSSSSSSYASTVTIIVVVASCVLGVWMLTSGNNAVVTPQPTTTSRTTSSTASENNTTTIPPNINEGPFEDNPGDLPDDALKSDHEPHKSQPPPLDDSNKESVGEEQDTSSQVWEESRVTQHQNQLQQQSSTDINEEGESETTKNENENENYNSEEDQQDQAEASKNNNNNNNNELGTQTQTHEEGKTVDSTKRFSDENQQGKKQEYEEDQHNGKQDEEKNESDKAVIALSYETKQEQSAKLLDEEAIFTKDDDQQSKLAGAQETKSGGSEEQEEISNNKQDSQEDNLDITSMQSTDQEKQTDETNSLLNSGIPKESTESKKSWSTQAAESNKEKERRKDTPKGKSDGSSIYGYTWQLCHVTAGPDYIPCLDNEKALKRLRTTKHFEHGERHCPEDPSTCLIPLPLGYKTPIPWPTSRDKIWFHNVPHTQLAELKGHQNWVKFTGEFLTFPGGGTQLVHGGLHYIDFIQQSVPGIEWGKHTRVILDVGCGVASFGGYLFDRDVLTMSFAPKDEHLAQVQFALERGIPAISAVMGSQRLPFPSGVFDLIHCARCRVPWHAEGGRLLLELNRVLRPGGHFVWSATPVYQKLQEDVEIWEAMSSLTASMCWKLETIQKDAINKIGAAIYRKPSNNKCYEQRQQGIPPMCKNDDDPNAAWYVPLQSCMHWVPVDQTQRGSRWPINWAKRLHTPPYWLNKSQMGIYGKPAPDDFTTDYQHWKQVVNNSYLTGLGISWKNVRNVMDMRAVYGGFAAALRDLQVWVLNVVNVNAPDTLPIIYERGLFGIYHDWCEGFSTYPRTYDLLHADHLFSILKQRCKLAPVMAEIDRIVRPDGKLIVRDESNAIGEVENLLKSLHWEVHLTFSKDKEGILSAQKSSWRPKE